jgi:hypothetical protein
MLSDASGSYDQRKWKANKELKDEIDSFMLAGFDTVFEKAWALWHNVFKRPRCKHCGKPTSLINFKKGFREVCSMKCAVKSKIVIKKSCMERYGVEHHMQDPSVIKRVMKAQRKARYKCKEYVSSSGKVYIYRGYEGYVIDLLIRAGVDENDITNDIDEVPSIHYRYDGKNRMYFPNIYVKSKNMLIEVKSIYTYAVEEDKNLAKQRAAKEFGHNHLIIIWDERESKILKSI